MRWQDKKKRNDYFQEIIRAIGEDGTIAKKVSIRAAVAASLNTSPELLDKMADDKSLTVRRAVADNKNAKSSTLLKVAKSCIKKDISFNIVRNKGDTLAAIEWIIENGSERDIRTIAAFAESEQVLNMVVDKVDEDLALSNVILNPISTPDIIRKIVGKAQFNSASIISALTYNRRTPPDIIEQIIALKYCNANILGSRCFFSLMNNQNLTRDNLIDCIDLIGARAAEHAIKYSKLLSEEEKNMLRIKYALV